MKPNVCNIMPNTRYRWADTVQIIYHNIPTERIPSGLEKTVIQIYRENIKERRKKTLNTFHINQRQNFEMRRAGWMCEPTLIHGTEWTIYGCNPKVKENTKCDSITTASMTKIMRKEQETKAWNTYHIREKYLSNIHFGNQWHPGNNRNWKPWFDKPTGKRLKGNSPQQLLVDLFTDCVINFGIPFHEMADRQVNG